MRRKIKNLASIFVEGATDRIMYKTFFVKVLGYDEIKDEELEIFQQEIKFGGELIPMKDSVVLYSDAKNSLVVIKSKNGKDELLKFARENIGAIKPLKRQVNELRNSEDVISEIKFPFIVYIFDKDVDTEQLEELRRSYADYKEVFIETHFTPEELGLEIFENHFLTVNHGWKEWFEECSKKLESLLDGNNKRRFLLMKAMIGERCFYQLFEELFKKEDVRKDLIGGQIKWINNLPDIV